MAKYNGVLPRTPQVRPKSEIDNPKRDDKHPRPFDMESRPAPSPGRQDGFQNRDKHWQGLLASQHWWISTTFLQITEWER